MQGIASSLAWIALSQLGNPTSKRRSSSVDDLDMSGWSPLTSDDDKVSRTGTSEISIIDDILPNMMTKNGVLMQILINAVLVTHLQNILIQAFPILPYFQSCSFLSFWAVMDLIS